jgi:heptosyltransferase-1
MGDILHALPAVTALRLLHPSWEIDWVVDPRWRALLSVQEGAGRGPQQPVVDRLHFAPTRLWRKSPLISSALPPIAQSSTCKAQFDRRWWAA